MFLFPLSLFNMFADYLHLIMNLGVELIAEKLNLEAMLLFRLQQMICIVDILELKCSYYTMMFPNIHRSYLTLPSYCCTFERIDI